MTVTTDTPRADAARSMPAARKPMPAPPVLRRPGGRNGKQITIGVLLAVAVVVAFWQADLRRHADETFLATANPVAAGQRIADTDLTVVRVADVSGLQLIPAASRADVVGRTAAAPIPAGTLLTAGQVGPAAWPPAGQAVIAVPVKPGRTPAGLRPGASVVVLVVPNAGSAGDSDTSGGNNKTGTGSRRAVATVVSVTSGADQIGTELVTLLLAADTAEQVAAAPGDVTLVQTGAKR
jgi:hypothetical protein